MLYGDFEEHPTRLVELNFMAHFIADEYTRSDIETICPRMKMDGLDWWLTASSTPHPAPIRDRLQRALIYLALRGLLVHHQRLPLLVRFTDVGSSSRFDVQVHPE